VPYAEISVKLGIPVGSIGPTRSRCLDKLRDHPAVAALIDTGSSPAGECNTAAAASGEVSDRFSGPPQGALKGLPSISSGRCKEGDRLP
jgi:hypothetical protein